MSTKLHRSYLVMLQEIYFEVSICWSSHVWRNHSMFKWIMWLHIHRFNVLLKWQLWGFFSFRHLYRVSILLVLLIWLYSICHGNWLQHWYPFGNLLLVAEVVVWAMVSVDVSVDVWVHAVASILVHLDWLDVHDWRISVACFSHRLSMMSVSSNAVWHLIVIHIAKLVLLRRDIGLDASCVGAV